MFVYQKKKLFIFTYDSDQREIKTGINDLAKIMANVQKELSYQNAEIKYVQSLIENCQSCKIVPEIETCESSSKCFPGAECFDTDNGVVCGKCPRGFKGDGINCYRVELCDENSCFS